MAPRLDPAQLDRLYGDARAARWALAREVFDATVHASVAHAFPARQPSAEEVTRYVTSLHIEDLALAAACQTGSDTAWEFFIAEHGPGLRRAADAMDPTGRAREIADALHADLYGLKEAAGSRQSLFRYFHGRSKLGTWLRAVLAQRHIDRIRGDRKLEPLPEDEASLPTRTLPAPDDPLRERSQMMVQTALSGAISALPPRDRLRLASYYVQDMTLAAIGRLLKEHEATVSRHLTRTRAALREAVEARLRTEHGLDDAAISECLRSVAADPGLLDVAELVGSAPVRKNATRDRSEQ